jgi:hypothetical protein
MPAVVTFLRTREDRLREDQAATLRKLVLALPDLPARAAGEIVAAIDRQMASRRKWTFVMLEPAQNAAVVDWLMAHSSQPMKAARVWAQCFTALRMDTGEITLTRDELAQRAGVPSDEISRIMGELESCGAIIRRREKIPGMRGPGRAVYFMNSRVGTHLTGAARDQARDDAPLLRLVEPPDGR